MTIPKTKVTFLVTSTEQWLNFSAEKFFLIK